MIPPEIPSSVVFLCCRHQGREPYPRGTGFFLRRIEEGRDFYYLVTARHIIDGIDGLRGSDHLVHVRVNVRGGGYRFIETPVGDWRSHPTDLATDVAVLPVDAALMADADALFVPFQAEGIPEAVTERHGPGDEVIVAGLLLNHYGRKRNLPIIRTGHLAAMPHEPIELPWAARKAGKPMEAYLVDTRSIGGLSGSPVYIRVAQVHRHDRPLVVPAEWYNRRAFQDLLGYYLLGLVHSLLFIHENELRTEVDPKADDREQNTGIAVVVPHNKIRETIDQPVLAERRRAVLAEEMRQRAAQNGPDL